MKFGIVQFPGSNCDADAFYVVQQLLKEEAFYLWHEEETLQNADCIILPGGFAHGDYLRAGAMAKISSIMKSVEKFAEAGGLVLGICNGFQILTEAGLLPGALLKNQCGKFICDWIYLNVENSETPFTRLYKKGEILRMPIAHGEGCYYLDEAGLEKLEKNGQVVFRYCDSRGNFSPESNPNGSLAYIAGICNKEKNVLGLMPHPERCAEPLLGGTDGLLLFQSLLTLKVHGSPASAL
jgi:phosphoribosylformylglycinamidine synthase I